MYVYTNKADLIFFIRISVSTNKTVIIMSVSTNKTIIIMSLSTKAIRFMSVSTKKVMLICLHK